MAARRQVQRASTGLELRVLAREKKPVRNAPSARFGIIDKYTYKYCIGMSKEDAEAVTITRESPGPNRKRIGQETPAGGGCGGAAAS